MQLAPGEQFAVVRQLGDPNDSNTYYVQAVIRDAHTDATLDTLNLIDRGSQRFTKLWTVYSKRSNAFYIDVTTSVYTDSGYTTKAGIYADESETYLVEARNYHPGGGGWGGSGAKIDYEKVREIVQAELTKLPKIEPQAPPDAYDDAELISAMKALPGAISGAVEGAKRDIVKEIKGIDMKPEITVEAPAVDMAPFETMAKEITKDVMDVISSEMSTHKEILKEIEDAIKQGNLMSVIEKIAREAIAKVTAPSDIPSPFETIREMRKKP